MRFEQVTLVTIPSPENATVQVQEVIGDPPVLFGDQFRVNWPETGLVGEEADGVAGAIASVPVERDGISRSFAKSHIGLNYFKTQ